MTQPTNCRAVLEQALDALGTCRIMSKDAEGNYTREVTPKIITAALTAGRAALEQPQGEAGPIAYIAWRNGAPCYEGDDAICEDAVWPVDPDDDRTSMPVYAHPQASEPAPSTAVESVPFSGADEKPPVFGRRWSLAVDGFGLQRDDMNGRYVDIEDALSVLHASLQSTAQPTPENGSIIFDNPSYAEWLATRPQCDRAIAAAKAQPERKDLNDLAKVYASSYASPHHITFTIHGLGQLVAEAWCVQQGRKPLTDSQIRTAIPDPCIPAIAIVRAVEAAHGIGGKP